MESSFCQLAAQLTDFSGSKAELIRVGNNYKASPRLFEFLIDFADNTDSPAAIALLKYYVSRGEKLPSHLTARLIDLLANTREQIAQLQLLQIVPHLQISKALAEPLGELLQRSLRSENKFVRAWAFTGFHQLAIHHPDYRAEAKALLRRAAKDESPAVRARLRQLPQL